MYMLGAKYGFGPSADFIAQTSDPRSAQQIRGFCCANLQSFACKEQAGQGAELHFAQRYDQPTARYTTWIERYIHRLCSTKYHPKLASRSRFISSCQVPSEVCRRIPRISTQSEDPRLASRSRFLSNYQVRYRRDPRISTQSEDPRLASRSRFVSS